MSYFFAGMLAGIGVSILIIMIMEIKEFWDE